MRMNELGKENKNDEEYKWEWDWRGKNDKREYIYIYIYLHKESIYNKKDTDRFSFIRFSLND